MKTLKTCIPRFYSLLTLHSVSSTLCLLVHLCLRGFVTQLLSFLIILSQSLKSPTLILYSPQAPKQLFPHRLRETATLDQLKQMEGYFPRRYSDLDDPTKDPLRDHCDVIIEKLGELTGMIRCAKCIVPRMNELNKAHAKLGISEECKRVSDL